MRQKIVLFLSVFFFSTGLLAFEISPNFILREGQSKLSVGGDILWGVLSPPAFFSEAPGLNRARMYEENITYARGVGHGTLKDMYVEVETRIFQSRAETAGGVVVHPADSGFAMLARSGGHFVHTEHFALGGWIQSGSPVLMDRSKFVNPVIDYVGGGLNTIVQFSRVFGMTNSVYVGSGLFLPRKRNPHVDGSTFFSINFSPVTKGTQDFVIKAGGVAAYDLTSRIDAAYQSSALADGRVKNFGFITPFLIDIPLGQTWRLEGGYAMQWFGKSVRGSRFTTFNISKIF